MSPDKGQFLSTEKSFNSISGFSLPGEALKNMDKNAPKTDFELSFDQKKETWFVSKICDELTKKPP